MFVNLWLNFTVICLHIQWNLRNKTTIQAMQSGLVFEVVLILRTITHVYMDLGLNQSGFISKAVVLYIEVVI